MTNFRIPEAILAQHTAILGKTGSGKTTTGKVCVEQVVDEDYRVCILDPVKSDWWGLTSSADGKRAGLPFTILGGPHGHVPLHHTSGKAIADVVGNGSLRLSILDMAQFPPGGAQHFFVDFIPRLMQKMKGVLYLVIEEAHEFAPKERAGFGKENMSIHFAKSVATGGRSKGIRLIVLDQRVQALHNAVLGSCETVVVHRMTQPADQEPVVKWMKANVKDKDLRSQITDSMSKLKTGTGWLCSGEADLFTLMEFPKAKTFDNSKTPGKDDDIVQVKTAQVDVESLRGIIGEAVAEAEANDPALLRKKISELEANIARIQHTRTHDETPPAAAPCPVDHDAVARESYKRGHEEGWKACEGISIGRERALIEETMGAFEMTLGAQVERSRAHVKSALAVPLFYPSIEAQKEISMKLLGTEVLMNPQRIDREGLAADIYNRGFQGDGVALTSMAHPVSTQKMRRKPISASSLETIEIEVKIGEAERRFLTVLAQRQGKRTSRDQLATFSGYPVKSRHTDNKLAFLRRGGLVEGPGDDIRITGQGLAEIGPYDPLPTGKSLREFWLGKMESEAERRILSYLFSVYPRTITRDALAAAVGYPVESRHTDNKLARLRSFGLIVGPGSAIAASGELY